MKNHWLDKKIDKEIDAALAEIENTNSEFKDTDFIDTDFIDLEMELTKEIDKEIIADLKIAEDKQDRETVKAILLKNMHKPHWIEEVLASVQYTPHLAHGPNIGNLTLSCCYGTYTTMNYFFPGGDGITLNDNITISSGFPQDDEKSIQGGCCGNFACNCSANLDIFYPNRFIQNEELQVLNTEVDKNGSDQSKYQVMYTPILPGTMTGTIHWDAGWGFAFSVSSTGDTDVRRFTKNDDGSFNWVDGQLGSVPLIREAGWYDNVYYVGLNLTTGELDIHHNRGTAPTVIISYEYQKEGSL